MTDLARADIPDAATPDAVVEAQARGADAILLGCVGSTECHRQALLPLDLPVLLSNPIAAKALSELPGG